MLKSIISSTCLMALATLSLVEIAPVMAAENAACGTCSSCCSRTRACEYSAKEVSLTPPPPLQPPTEPPVILVDPPPVVTPVSPRVPFIPKKPPRGRG